MTKNTYEFLNYYIRYNSWIRSSYQTSANNRILVNSVPKSGTHLLMKALELTPGINRAPIQFGRQRIGLLPWCLSTCPSLHPVILAQFYAQKRVLQANAFNEIPIDSDSPFYLSKSQFRNIITLIQPSWFAMGHLPHSSASAKIISEERVKMLLILRDPRDVIVSHANYIAKKSSHYMHNLYRNLSEKDRIMTSIKGVSASNSHPRMVNIRDKIQGVVAWMNHPSTYTTFFEKLIGPQGNGSRSAQVSELKTIMEHLGLQISNQQLSAVASEIFGGTRTFRQGVNGRWKQFLDDEHKQTCKDLIGDFLIEFGYEKNFDW